jgi:hypothetical protein
MATPHITNSEFKTIAALLAAVFVIFYTRYTRRKGLKAAAPSSSDGTGHPINRSISKDEEVWIGSGVGSFFDGILGVVTNHRATLTLSAGSLQLTRGERTMFSAPVDHVVVQQVLASGGALRFTIEGSSYTVLCYRPFWGGIGDPKGTKAKSWVEMLRTAGAVAV